MKSRNLLIFICSIVIAVSIPFTYTVYWMAKEHPDALLILVTAIVLGIIISLVMSLSAYLNRKAIHQDNVDDLRKLGIMRARQQQIQQMPMLPYPGQVAEPQPTFSVGEYVDNTEAIEIN